jgi:virginiamycin B lyase
VTEFPTPTLASKPETITAAPDGNLWFTESAGNNIATATTAGAITEFPSPTGGSIPDGIAVGPDGNVWFTEFYGHHIARVALGGRTVLELPTAFAPRSIAVASGTELVWMVRVPGPHSVTDASGMGLFDSGFPTPVSYFAYRFLAAGTYPVVDRGTGETATVTVAVDARPASGTTATTFRISWARSKAPPGFAYDVQIRRPGDPVWTTWRAGVSIASATFHADAGAGAYRFRARLRRRGGGGTSGYSSATKIIVA